jgi:hypothetical protein
MNVCREAIDRQIIKEVVNGNIWPINWDQIRNKL